MSLVGKNVVTNKASAGRQTLYGCDAFFLFVSLTRCSDEFCLDIPGQACAASRSIAGSTKISIQGP